MPPAKLSLSGRDAGANALRQPDARGAQDPAAHRDGADPEGEIGENHDPETHLIPLVLDVASGTRDYIEIFGTDYETADGTWIRDYIHVSDFADAHKVPLEHLLKGGKSDAFSLGNGSGFSVREVISTVGKITGCDISFRESIRRPGNPPSLIESSEKVKKE